LGSKSFKPQFVKYNPYILNLLPNMIYFLGYYPNFTMKLLV